MVERKEEEKKIEQQNYNRKSVVERITNKRLLSEINPQNVDFKGSKRSKPKSENGTKIESRSSLKAFFAKRKH